ncbi:MAG: molybdopterin-dependent oxidoreductase [Brevefilum sp.]|nr:molybdopterin-dependent oxidoreductase [Brevefilum sp.]
MKKVNKSGFTIVCFAMLIVLSSALTACSSAPNVEWELSITGAVSNPTVFTYRELVDLPQVELNEVLMEKSRGEDEIRSFSGVDLALLLEQAGVQDNFSSITAKAADGYAIEITPDEMVGGIIALKDHEDWIAKSDPKAGPIRLVFPATPANRWVFQVNEIVVNP